jgi:ferredoxin
LGNGPKKDATRQNNFAISEKVRIFAFALKQKIDQLLILKNRNKMAYKITDICVACGTCIDECPVGAISEGDIYKIDENACVSCGTCAGACPTGAIQEG